MLPKLALFQQILVGIEPKTWLKDVLEKLRDDTTQEDLRIMLPYYYKKTRK